MEDTKWQAYKKRQTVSTYIQVDNKTIRPSGKQETITVKKAACHDCDKVYSAPSNRKNVCIVVSFFDNRLYVYERLGVDNVKLLAHFMACFPTNIKQKQRSKDYAAVQGSKTAGVNWAKDGVAKDCAFIVSKQDYGAYVEDHKGIQYKYKAYGKWFFRLNLKNVKETEWTNPTIGIHGCGDCTESVPGWDSHGCLRTTNSANLKLETMINWRVFKSVRGSDTATQSKTDGTPVFLRPYGTDKWDWEKKAEQALGSKYLQQTKCTNCGSTFDPHNNI